MGTVIRRCFMISQQLESRREQMNNDPVCLLYTLSDNGEDILGRASFHILTITHVWLKGNIQPEPRPNQPGVCFNCFYLIGSSSSSFWIQFGIYSPPNVLGPPSSPIVQHFWSLRFPTLYCHRVFWPSSSFLQVNGSDHVYTEMEGHCGRGQLSLRGLALGSLLLLLHIDASHRHLTPSSCGKWVNGPHQCRRGCECVN